MYVHTCVYMGTMYRYVNVIHTYVYKYIWCVAMHENTYAVNYIFTYDVVEEVDFIDAHNACIFILI